MGKTFSERKESILNALIERKGIQHLTDVASETLNNPVFLYDISGKILAVSRRPGDQVLWDQILPGGHLKEEYDQKYRTTLKNSVEMYLESGRNIQKAAEKMNIHKNTLRYRLERAQELFDFDLSDENTCFNFQFSLRMRRMIR